VTEPEHPTITPPESFLVLFSKRERERERKQDNIKKKEKVKMELR